MVRKATEGIRSSLTTSPDHTPNIRAASTRPSRVVLQDPLPLFIKTVCRELGMERPHTRPTLMRVIGPDHLAAAVAHCAIELLVAQSRALLVEGWLRYKAEHQEIGLTKATEIYVRLLRGCGVKTSKSSLHSYLEQSKESGLEGLAPHRNGGRPIRIPAVDRSLILTLLRHTTPSYRLYLVIRRLGRLPGKPVTRSAFERFIKDFSETTKSPARKSDKGRRRSNPADEMRQGLTENQA
jgi:hypothetical protein